MITDFLKHRLQKLRLKNESYDIPHKIQTEWITNSNFGLTDNEIKEFDQIFDRMKIHEFTFNELQWPHTSKTKGVLIKKGNEYVYQCQVNLRTKFHLGFISTTKIKRNSKTYIFRNYSVSSMPYIIGFRLKLPECDCPDLIVYDFKVASLHNKDFMNSFMKTHGLDMIDLGKTDHVRKTVITEIFNNLAMLLYQRIFLDLKGTHVKLSPSYKLQIKVLGRRQSNHLYSSYIEYRDREQEEIKKRFIEMRLPSIWRELDLSKSGNSKKKMNIKFPLFFWH